MQITREFIATELANLAANREQALRMVEQISGAEAAFKAMLRHLDELEPKPEKAKAQPKKRAAPKPAESKEAQP